MVQPHKIKLGVLFIQTLTFKKLVNALLIRVSYVLSILLHKQMHWGKPESLSIEPTNLCNLKCPECPSGNNSMTRSRLFLSKHNFERTIDASFKYLSYLQLYFQGEPFMHPKLTEYIKLATSKNVFTTTSTNGHFLDAATCQKIIDSGLHQLIVSIDGTSQQSYSKYRVGGDLEQVKKGIRLLQQAKEQHKSRVPHIVIQFVVFSTNEHEIGAIKQLATALNVTDLRLKSAQIEDFKKGHSLMPKNAKYNRYKQQDDGTYKLNRKSNFKCFRVWSGSVLSANNELLPCCFDKDATHAYASLNNEGLFDVWKNKESKSFRQKVWRNPEEISMCTNCTEGLKRTWFFQ